MRLPMIREDDGSVAMLECELCGSTLYRGEMYYHVNGEVFCPACLEDYARVYLEPYMCVAGEEWL